MSRESEARAAYLASVPFAGTRQEAEAEARRIEEEGLPSSSVNPEEVES